MYVSKNKTFNILINGVMSSFQHHARKILMYFNNSWLVETKEGNNNRMKAADIRYSICPYISIASYKKVRLEKRTGGVANTHTRELHGKRHDLTWLKKFRT